MKTAKEILDAFNVAYSTRQRELCALVEKHCDEISEMFFEDAQNLYNIRITKVFAMCVRAEAYFSSDLIFGWYCHFLGGAGFKVKRDSYNNIEVSL